MVHTQMDILEPVVIILAMEISELECSPQRQVLDYLRKITNKFIQSILKQITSPKDKKI